MMNETTGIGGTLSDDSNGHSDEHDAQGEDAGSGQTGYTDPVLSKLDEVVMCLTKISVSLERIARVYTQPPAQIEAEHAMANAPAIVGTKSSSKKKVVSKTRGKVARKK